MEAIKSMAKQNGPDRVPGRNEPDPMNIRQRSFQAGTDGLTQPPTDRLTYGDMEYATPALFNDPELGPKH